MNRVGTSWLTATFAVCTFAWTGVGESSNPELLVTELPLSIANDCAAQDDCTTSKAFVMRWISRNVDSDLFLVRRASCKDQDCSAWFVEKTPRGTVTRLTVEGGFRLVSGAGGYPDVQATERVSDIENHYSYYVWRGGRYEKTESRVAYSVDGVECGTREECYQVALKAYKASRRDRALKIWETVNNVNWI
jgi:hypothetical protein